MRPRSPTNNGDWTGQEARSGSNGSRRPTRSLGRRLDALGLVLVASSAGWTLAAAAISGGDPGPPVALYAAVAAALIGARLARSASRWLVPALAVAVAAALMLASPEGIFTATPRAGPFGFSSITGAFYVQASFAAMMAAAAAPPAARPLGALGTVVFAIVPLATHTRAAAIVLFAFGGAALIVRTGSGRRRLIAWYAAVVVVALAVTVVLGASYAERDGTTVARWTGAALTGRRIALWHDALAMMATHPLTGVGPGRVGALSPVARSDPDDPWAHNEFLQQGAETGIPGFLLVTALFLWGFARLLTREPDVAAVLGGAALASLGVHACVQYVLQRPAVPILAAALLGTAIGPFEREGA